MTVIQPPRTFLVPDFDEVKHVYTYGGREFPGPTAVLAGLGFIDYSFLKERREYFLERGKAFHLATEFDDRGTLDDDALHPDLRGRVAAYRLWKRETGFVPDLTEQAMVDPVDGAAGKLDRRGRLCLLPGAPRAVVDFKSGAVQRWVGLQLSCYDRLQRGEDRAADPLTRLAVEFKDNGTYRQTFFTDLQDEEDWLACLAAFHAKLRITGGA